MFSRVALSLVENENMFYVNPCLLTIILTINMLGYILYNLGPSLDLQMWKLWVIYESKYIMIILW